MTSKRASLRGADRKSTSDLRGETNYQRRIAQEVAAKRPRLLRLPHKTKSNRPSEGKDRTHPETAGSEEKPLKNEVQCQVGI